MDFCPQKMMSQQEKAQQMFALVEQWQQSGESQKSFSERHQINIHTFRYWVFKKQKDYADTSGFIQLNHSIGDNISLRYPNGIEVLLPSNVSAKLLAELIKL